MVEVGSQDVSRRHFLALGALTGVAGVAGCAGTAATSKPASSAAAPAPAATTGGPLDLAGLKRALDGKLVLPGDPGYTVASQPYNVALGTRKPAAIAQVTSVADVRTTVRRVRGHGVTLAARSGGHSYTGYSTPNGGVVVDVGALKSIKVDSDGTAVVGAGARLIDVYAALAAQGRAIPAGSCPTVGVAGSTLGGGIGVVSRSLGLTCDHVKAMTVVTADGAVHTADADRDADLFWALRGGGGGNGGIVTDFTFTTVAAPTVTIFTLRFPAASTATVLQKWSGWVSGAARNLTALCAVTAAGTPTNRLTGTWTGDPAGLTGPLNELISAVGVAPASRSTHTYTYLDAMKSFASCLNKTVAACHPASTPGGTLPREAFRAGSRVLENGLDATTAGKIVALMSQQRGMVLLFDSLGGEVGALRPTDTAFVHRTAHASVQIYSGSASGGPAVARIQQALTPLVGRGAYVNYINADQADWATAYYGANLSKLRSVVGHYDPDGVFSFPQSVLRA